MGVVGWGSPLLLIFCILGWGLGVHVFRLLDSQTAPFQLLAKHQVPDSLQPWGCVRILLCWGQGCTHSSVYSYSCTTIPALLIATN